MVTIEKPAIGRATVYQLIVLLILVMLARSLWDFTLAYSVLLGGLVHAIPQAWFASIAFRHRGARATSKILGTLYRGEAGKLLMTATMFALIFIYVEPLQVPAVFLSYFAMAIVYSFSSVKILYSGRS